MLTVEGYKYSQERRQNGRARVHLPGARAFWPGRTRARASICRAPGLSGEKGVKMDARASICRAPGPFGLKERARVYLPGARAFLALNERARVYLPGARAFRP